MQIIAKVFLCVSIYGVGVAMVQGASLNREVLPHSAVVASDGSVTLRDQEGPARSTVTAVVASDGSVAVNREGTSVTGGPRWSKVQKLVANTKKSLHQSVATVEKNTKEKIEQQKQKWEPIVKDAGAALEQVFRKYGMAAKETVYAAAEEAALACKNAVEDEIDKISETAQAELWPKIEVAKTGAELTVAQTEQQIDALLTAIEEENWVAAAVAFDAVNETVHEIKEELIAVSKAVEAHAPYLVAAAEVSIANVNAACMTSVTNEIEQAKQGLAGLALKALEEAEPVFAEFQKEVNAFKEDALKIIQAEYEKLLKDLEEASTEAIAEYSELER